MQTKQRVFVWVIMVCMAFVVCVTGSAFAASTGSVKGTVHKNSASGKDLSGVKVTCGGKSDTTNSKGKFEIKKISTGNHTLTFSKSGYESFQTSVKIVKGKTANVGDRWLTGTTGPASTTSSVPATTSSVPAATGSVSGKMHKNSASGATLSGVSVSCGGKSDTTDSGGNFKVGGVSAGDHSISFSKSGYEPFQTDVKIVVGKNANLGNRWLAEKVTTGSVSGKLHKNSAKGSALSGVSVTCAGKNGTTDGSGNFKLEGISAGDQSVSFSKSGYEPFQTNVKIVADKKANIGDRWLTEKGTAVDKEKPRLISFGPNKATIKAGESVEISYSVSDAGGSGLKQVELWKGKDKGSLGHYKTDSVKGNGPVSGKFTDSPSPAGTHYYGIHVLDNKDNLAYDDGARPVVVVSDPKKSEPPNSNFVFPLPVRNLNSGYFDPAYAAREKVQHLGVDYMANKDTEVRPVCNGIVEFNYTNNSDVMQSFMVIKHNCEGKTFWGHYGHIKSSLTKGTPVYNNVKIGTIKDWGRNSHLHFGINVSKAVYKVEDNNGWGRGRINLTREEANKLGWKDPVEYFGW